MAKIQERAQIELDALAALQELSDTLFVEVVVRDIKTGIHADLSLYGSYAGKQIVELAKCFAEKCAEV
jgi:hypothetical protein